jgi:DNA-binding NtrC family response regulator
MDRGLKSVKAAKDLETNFNDLVACALKTLEKKAFIITLDDIDVDFRKGWPVLETIRKYLTSPQIIVLLSGDLKLYSKAIRKQQWKNFGKALLVNEAEALNKTYTYNDLVTEMEGQYLNIPFRKSYYIQI